MRRRELIALLGSVAAASPFAARAQQKTIPVIGLLTSRARGDAPQLMAALAQGLKDAGFVEGENVAIESRFADNQADRLPELAANLVRRQVTVIAAITTPAAVAAKAATTTIPIVFEMGSDPVQLGVVASLARPGGNVTGATQLNVETAPKRLEFLHELVPSAKVIGLLVNPGDPAVAEPQASKVLAAAHAMGLELPVLNARSEHDFDAVFTSLIQLRAGGLVVGTDPFFTAREEQLAALAVRHAMPAIGETRDFVAAGGLMNYGGNLTDAYRLAGAYVGRVLKGERPGDLAVQQATKVALFVNLKAAKALGLVVPQSLLARAEEVIE